MREDEAKDLPRGTRITLHLKGDATELADATKLGNLIKQYSEFIQFPIKLWSSKTEYEQVCPPSRLRSVLSALLYSTDLANAVLKRMVAAQSSILLVMSCHHNGS